MSTGQPLLFWNHSMRSLWRRLLYLAVAIVVLVGGFLGWAYHATQQAPEFYVRQLAAEAASPSASSDAFERQALQLNNQIRKSDRWQARFRADEINAWLATDLPQKFPSMLPPDIQSPRVAIEAETFYLACRVQTPKLTSVVTLGVQPYVTSEPNVIALRVKQLRAGVLPLPLGKYLDQITEQCAQAGLPLRWSEEEGDPVALFTLPLTPEDFRNRLVRVEQIELEEGELILSGTSEPVPSQ